MGAIETQSVVPFSLNNPPMDLKDTIIKQLAAADSMLSRQTMQPSLESSAACSAGLTAASSGRT